MSTINPQEFGAMQATVEQLADDMAEVKKDVKLLLAEKHQRKGAMWAGRAMMGAVGGALVFIADRVFK